MSWQQQWPYTFQGFLEKGSYMAHTTDQHCLVSRSFLVHLRTDADIPGGRVVGRVEHVPSGDAAHFQSIDELLSFMAALLDADQDA
jgi:hypothetical protein